MVVMIHTGTVIMMVVTINIGDDDVDGDGEDGGDNNHWRR